MDEVSLACESLAIFLLRFRAPFLCDFDFVLADLSAGFLFVLAVKQVEDVEVAGVGDDGDDVPFIMRLFAG